MKACICINRYIPVNSAEIRAMNAFSSYDIAAICVAV